jgi:hypothetical protein
MKLILLKSKNQILNLLIFVLCNSIFYSQENQCDIEISNSIEKLFLKGKNYKKYDYKNRLKFFKNALEIQDDCVPCIWELAKMSFRRKYITGDIMDFPKKYFLKLENLCPSYHADIYYYLSLIYYMEKDDCLAS